MEQQKSTEILKGRGAPGRSELYEYSASHDGFIKNIADCFSTEEWEEILKKRDDFFLRFQHLYADLVSFKRAGILQASLSKKYLKGSALDVALISSIAALIVYLTSNLAWAALGCLNVPMVLHRINQYRTVNIVARIDISSKENSLQSSFRSIEKLAPGLTTLNLYPQRILQLAVVKFYFSSPVEALKIFDTLNVYGVNDEERLIRIWGFNPKKNLAYDPIIGGDSELVRQDIDEILKKKFLILAARMHSIAKFEAGVRLHFKENYIDFTPSYYWDFRQYTSPDSLEIADKTALGKNFDEDSFDHFEIREWYVSRSLYD